MHSKDFAEEGSEVYPFRCEPIAGSGFREDIPGFTAENVSTGNFKITLEKYLAEGGFGKVFRASIGGKNFAVKFAGGSDEAKHGAEAEAALKNEWEAAKFVMAHDELSKYYVKTYLSCDFSVNNVTNPVSFVVMGLLPGEAETMPCNPNQYYWQKKHPEWDWKQRAQKTFQWTNQDPYKKWAGDFQNLEVLWLKYGMWDHDHILRSGHNILCMTDVTREPAIMLFDLGEQNSKACETASPGTVGLLYYFLHKGSPNKDLENRVREIAAELKKEERCAPLFEALQKRIDYVSSGS